MLNAQLLFINDQGIAPDIRYHNSMTRVDFLPANKIPLISSQYWDTKAQLAALVLPRDRNDVANLADDSFAR